MQLEVPVYIVKQMRSQGCTNEALTSDHPSYWTDNHTIRINSFHLGERDLAILKALVKQDGNYAKLNCRRVYSQLCALERVNREGVDKTKTKNLETLRDIIIGFCRELPHHWVFHMSETYKTYLPYMVTSCDYFKRQRDIPAHTRVMATAIVRGRLDTVTAYFYQSDLGKSGITAHEALVAEGLIPESPELVASYTKDLEFYKIIHDKLGDQFLATGFGQSDKNDSRWWVEASAVCFDRDGHPSKVIMDDSEGWGDKTPSVTCGLWSRKPIKDDGGDEDDPSLTVNLPAHPIVRCFDLHNHVFVKAHTTSLAVYNYNPALAEKLVLPSDSRQLIDVLLSSAQEVQHDIIQGKAGGTIILCSGRPGTGKTLTAEVYSEVAQRPLYIVQCSQLGTDHSTLEETLATVLHRAVRWKAILLIDEADVYIHERGTNMKQNAVVGVFLRLLEYFSGVLFLTTNRATIVDDAILSRVMAHVKYDVPQTQSDKERLWLILGTQYKCDVTPQMAQQFSAAFPNASGRSVKQLLRLARVLALKKQEPVSIDLLKWVAQFQEVEQ